MLHCTGKNAAMQTNALFWYVVYIKYAGKDGMAIATRKPERPTMPKTAAVALPPSATLFGRLLASIDRLLMTNAQIAVRNGDVPHFGL
jgi:hypothetical protein